MASVFLGDLDDFIQPSQSCVNPMFTDPKGDAKQTTESTSVPGMAKIQLDTSGFNDFGSIGFTEEVRPNLIKTNDTKTATVSLNDCLACSGCVTSAETVLITQQSLDEFVNKLKERQFKKAVVSIAPQARASIAKYYGLTDASTHGKLVTLFRQLGVDMVLDTTASGDFALLEARAEFVARFRDQQVLPWSKPPDSIAESSTKTLYPTANETEAHEPPTYTAMPMLASACPGWICYAEKSQKNVLPYISTTKSPQQIMGALIKHVLCPKLGAQPNEVYHVCIMPCYDKKLEASRKDFFDEVAQSNDVDSVLVTTEVINLIDFNGIDFKNLPESDLTADELYMTSAAPDGKTLLSATSGRSGSGGYLEHIFRYASKELFGVDVQGELEYKQGRNPDFQEVNLVVEGKTVLSFAQAYGFRNIQGIVTKIKRKKCPYHFVEIMACPSGCLNGGGQVRPENKDKGTAEKLIADVERTFQGRLVRDPVHNPACQQIYSEVLVQPFSEQARKLLHTRYHAVPKFEMSNPLGIKW